MKNFGSVRLQMFHCEGKSCQKAGAQELTEALRAEMEKQGLKDAFHTTRTLCQGACECAPVVVLHPQGLVYGELRIADAQRCIRNWSQNIWSDALIAPVAAYGFGPEYLKNQLSLKKRA
jgi:NADH:ubiquinone oxidoreductase subunit E